MGRVQRRAPSRLQSSFDPTSLSGARRNSVSDYEKGRLAGQILIAITGRSGRCQKCASKNFDPPVQTTLNSSRKISWTLFSPQILVPVIFIKANRFLCTYELRQVRVSKKSVEFVVLRPQ